MPGDLARTSRLIPWLAKNFGPKLRLNLMPQYQPMHLARSRPEDFDVLPALLRPLMREEYEQAADLAKREGLTRVLL